jgi:hypothetical protein
MRAALYLTLALLLSAFAVKAQDMTLYELQQFTKPSNQNVGFISLSDNYPISDDAAPSALPPDNQAVYFKLDSQYRKKFLTATKVSETDKVFVYDYGTDVTAQFTVSQLSVVAFLSPYIGPEEGPFAAGDYMIGFEIDGKLLKGFSDSYVNNVVFISKQNPFTKGQVQPVVWKNITAKEFPAVADIPEMKEKLKTYGKQEGVGYYKYEADGLRYFVHDIIADMQTSVRRLVVMDAKTNKMVAQTVFYAQEGSSPSPLNGMNEESSGYTNQFVGKLFKDLPPVVVGFEYVSFGCPYIFVVQNKPEEIYINCDNRH